jgi:hypothetical protein
MGGSAPARLGTAPPSPAAVAAPLNREMPSDEHRGETQWRDRRRSENERKAGGTALPTDAQGLVAFRCECMLEGCETSVRIPLDVYRRVLAARNQCLVHQGHHPFARYRTIVSKGLLSIEEAVGE